MAVDVSRTGARLSTRSGRIIEHPRAFGVALILTTLGVAMYVATVVFAFNGAVETAGEKPFFDVVLPLTPMLAFLFVGGLLAARRPDNAVGWVCLASGMFWMLVFFHDGYAAYGEQVLGHAPPLRDWIYLPGWAPALGLFATFLLLLFPNGHLPSRRWLPVAWLAGVAITVMTLNTAFTPESPGQPLPDVPDVLHWLRPVASALTPLIVLFPVACLLCAASLAFRYRRATAEDREKIKWIAFAAVLVIGVYAIVFALSIRTDWDGARTPFWLGLLQKGTLVTFSFIPIAVAIAVLRYRLYGIDRIISRTLSYAVVTAVLAGTYAVVVLGPLSVASSGGRPQWLVAVGTLAAAALFSPVRRRVQSFVDHRFDRRRYNASQTIDSFAARMRRQIDLDDLGAELTDVVSRTMQPAHLSLWLPTRGFTARNVPGTAPH